MNRYSRALLLLLSFSVGCVSSADREYSLPDEDLITLMRSQKTFSLNEVKYLPAGAPDPGIRKALAEILTSAGLKEDPASPLKITVKWTGKGRATDYRGWGKKDLGQRFTAADVTGVLLLEGEGLRYSDEFRHYTITPAYTSFETPDHMKRESEAPFDVGVFAPETGPVLSLLRISAAAYGDGPVLKAMAHRDSRMRYYGAKVAGEFKMESARPTLEKLIQQKTPESFEYSRMRPEDAAGQALNRLPLAESTRSLLLRLAEGESDSRILAIRTLLNYDSQDLLPDVLSLLASSQYFNHPDTQKLLLLVEEKCDERCKPGLLALKARCESELKKEATDKQSRIIRMTHPLYPAKDATRVEAYEFYISTIDRLL